MTTTLHGHTLPDLPPGLTALAEGVRHVLAGECDCCGCWDSDLHEGQCSACDGRLAVAAHTVHGWPKAPSPAEALNGRIRRMLEALARRIRARRYIDPMGLDHPLPAAIAMERAENTVLDDLETLLLDMDAAARAAGGAA